MSPFQSMKAQPTSSSTECPMNAEQCFGAERWGQTPKLHSALETGREASKLLTADVPCAQTICTLGSSVLFKKNPCPPFVRVAWVSLADLHHMSPLLPYHRGLQWVQPSTLLYMRHSAPVDKERGRGTLITHVREAAELSWKCKGQDGMLPCQAKPMKPQQQCGKNWDPLTYKLPLHFSVRGIEERQALISVETEGFRLDSAHFISFFLRILWAVSKALLRFKHTISAHVFLYKTS